MNSVSDSLAARKNVLEKIIPNLDVILVFDINTLYCLRFVFDREKKRLLSKHIVLEWYQHGNITSEED